jgi:hypothetical protein
MIDVVGYAAATAVLATFLMRTMPLLRLVAILSNILFIIYGYSAHIPPVLLLHLALLPINVTRLVGLRHYASAGHTAGVFIKQKPPVDSD